MEIILAQIVTGLSIASILLLVALGLAIIYGTTGVINMAHGELVMLGAYSAWALQTYAGIGLLASLVIIFFAELVIVLEEDWKLHRGIAAYTLESIWTLESIDSLQMEVDP